VAGSVGRPGPAADLLVECLEAEGCQYVFYAESFGIAGFRPGSAADLEPTLRRALDVDGPAVVDVPIDHRENLRLTHRLGALAGHG
jgi:thiamine pyrophosphate-dependent acetolactate synthase large subunit-like protein